MPITLHHLLQGRKLRFCAIGDGGKTYEIRKFLNGLQKSCPADHKKMMARIVRTINEGPSKNTEHWRWIHGNDYQGMGEMKVHGRRVLCMVEDDRLLVCSHGIGKIKEKEFEKECQHARRMMDGYETAKKNQTLVEDDKELQDANDC